MHIPKITNLRLTNFRNISHLSLEIPQRIILIQGENGLGKTNILDALSRVNTHRGLKNQHSKECVNVAYPQGGWGVGLEFDNQDILKYGRTTSHSKLVYQLNHVPVAYDILKTTIPILWLSPVGEKLFTEEHQNIRAYIDGLIDIIFPAFNGLKSAYDKALRQRLKLLQDHADPSWINALEFEIAQNAVQIIHLRHAFLEAFKTSYEAIIADTKEGFPEFLLDINCNTHKYQNIDAYQTQLKATRIQDRQAGRSLFGIHRSRIQVIHHAKNIDIYYCSTGEQKAILTHILWVMNDLVQKTHHIAPIILFDDAMAHYDRKRCAFFYNYMQYNAQNQFFLTNTEFSDDVSHGQDMYLIDLYKHLFFKEKLFA